MMVGSSGLVVIVVVGFPLPSGIFGRCCSVALESVTSAESGLSEIAKSPVRSKHSIDSIGILVVTGTTLNPVAS